MTFLRWCFKPNAQKGTFSQIHPAPAPVSASRSPQTVIVPASPTQQICTQLFVSKTKRGDKTLTCDFFGGMGCFVCDLTNLKPYLLDATTRFVSNNGTVLNNKAIYDFIQTPGICVKIFFVKENQENRTGHYQTEIDSCKILKQITKEHFTTFTTYAEYADTTGFTIEFGDNYKVNIEGKPTKSLRCILQKQCNTDLHNLIMNNKYIDITVFFKNIACMLKLLHRNGYAHCDIKPENIVYCANEPIQYKLIDFNLKKYTEIQVPLAFTYDYMLPKLYQEIHNNQQSLEQFRDAILFYKEFQRKYPGQTIDFIIGNLEKSIIHAHDNDKETIQINIDIFKDIIKDNPKETIDGLIKQLKEAIDSMYQQPMQDLIGLYRRRYGADIYLFLLEKSNDEMDNIDYKKYPKKNLYFKSDEYAMAMVLSKLYGFQTIDTFNATGNEEIEYVKNRINDFTSPNLYFFNISRHDCESYMNTLVPRTGGRRKAIKKPQKTRAVVKDTSKKSSH